MSIVERPETRTLPPLIAGQRLDQPTFHERYEAMPPETRAELVGGIVYVPSPLRYDHGTYDNDVAGWLFLYRRATPGIQGALNATTILGPYGEPQPDAQLRIPEELGGQTRIDEAGHVRGAPELIVEISGSSRSYDLVQKKADYERAGVLEYVCVLLGPEEVRWFVRRGDRFVTKPPDADGIFRSEVFPGLWLDPDALFTSDLDRLIGVLEQGLATPEHAAFVARLAEARKE